MSYATIAEFFVYGLPVTARGQMTDAQIQGALDSASSEMDGHFRGRPYALPLLSWGVEIKRINAVMAAWELMGVRGFNPAGGADPVLAKRFDDAMSLLKSIQRKAYHPEVVESPNVPAGKRQPRMVSSSVVTATGRVAPNRGW
jgi:phage gp36-like protein